MDTNKFNFTKAKDPTLLEFKSNGVIKANVSPLMEGHSLYIPSVDKVWPQYIHSVSVIQELLDVVESLAGSWVAGYNSVGAYSSVNHLHFHLVPTPSHLTDQDGPTDQGGCYHTAKEAYEVVK